MIAGPVLCGLAMVCFILTGPVGPCGPSSALGLPLMIAGFLSGAIGWVMSLTALIGATWRISRFELVWPAAIAALAAGALAGVAAFTMAEGPDSSTAATITLVGLWPPLTAAGVHIRRWLRTRTHEAAPVSGHYAGRVK